MSVLQAAVDKKQVVASAPPLAPKLAPWMHHLLSKSDLIVDLLKTHGSPTHAVVDHEFRRNVKDLLSPLKSRGVDGNLFFARKANKLPWFVSLAKEEGIGVDTASRRELDECLALGMPGDRLVVTAIGKDQSLITAAMAAGCLIVTDNLDELQLINAVAAATGMTARVGVRFSGFRVQGRHVFSRFGFPVSDAGEVFLAIARSKSMKLELLHAHLDRYDIDERAAAARHLMALSTAAASAGHQIKAIDLGGGILMRYLERKEEFAEFRRALLESVQGKRRPFTFRGDGLGYHNAGEIVVGEADLYPAWNDCSKERFIAGILDRTDGGVPLYKELADRKLRLYFEPGRALLDNVGMTFAEVTFRKRDSLGNLLVGLSMNRTHLRPFRAEFCSDPIVLSSARRKPAEEGAFLVGNLCSESDLIYRRKIALPFMPIPGDIFCFANTAGYLAHHLEVGTHGSGLPANVMLSEKTLAVTAVFAK